MAEITVEQVFQMAGALGLEVDEGRARVIASRLSGVIEGLGEIGEEMLTRAEPAHEFSVEPEMGSVTDGE